MHRLNEKIDFSVFIYSKFVKVPKRVLVHRIQTVQAKMNQQLLLFQFRQPESFNRIRWHKRKRLKLELKYQPWLIMCNRCTSAVLKTLKVRMKKTFSFCCVLTWKYFILCVEKNRCYEMSSFDEKQATTLLKERPIEFVNYNKHQLSRVYPAGTRFDSSNFMPQVIIYC